jgi:hypothetical protein
MREDARALVSGWPAVALAASFELLMTPIRAGHHACADPPLQSA